MKKLSLAFFAFATLFLASAKPAWAQSCTTQYGGDVVCVPNDLTINKQVINPATNLFVENLTESDPAFSPGSEVRFRLTIKNASGETFNPVTVKDIFPEHLTFKGGPGNFDQDTHALTFTLDNMIAGETRTVEILAKVDGKNAFPANQSITCLNNIAQAKAAGREVEDRAQFCVQTNVLGATNLPVAGVDDLPLILPFVGVGLSGLALLLKRK